MNIEGVPKNESESDDAYELIQDAELASTFIERFQPSRIESLDKHSRDLFKVLTERKGETYTKEGLLSLLMEYKEALKKHQEIIDSGKLKNDSSDHEMLMGTALRLRQGKEDIEKELSAMIDESN